jgi:hypothetical protein
MAQCVLTGEYPNFTAISWPPASKRVSPPEVGNELPDHTVSKSYNIKPYHPQCPTTYNFFSEKQQMGNADSKDNDSQRLTKHEARGNRLKEAVCTGLAMTAAQVLQGEVAIGISVTATVEYVNLVSYHQSSTISRTRCTKRCATGCRGLQIYVVAS